MNGNTGEVKGHAQGHGDSADAARIWPWLPGSGAARARLVAVQPPGAAHSRGNVKPDARFGISVTHTQTFPGPRRTAAAGTILISSVVRGSGLAFADTKRNEQYSLKVNIYFGEQKAALIKMN